MGRGALMEASPLLHFMGFIVYGYVDKNGHAVRLSDVIESVHTDGQPNGKTKVLYTALSEDEAVAKCKQTREVHLDNFKLKNFYPKHMSFGGNGSIFYVDENLDTVGVFITGHIPQEVRDK
jgi:hypothetical protein